MRVGSVPWNGLRCIIVHLGKCRDHICFWMLWKPRWRRIKQILLSGASVPAHHIIEYIFRQTFVSQKTQLKHCLFQLKRKSLTINMWNKPQFLRRHMVDALKGKITFGSTKATLFPSWSSFLPVRPIGYYDVTTQVLRLHWNLF